LKDRPVGVDEERFVFFSFSPAWLMIISTMTDTSVPGATEQVHRDKGNED